MSEIPYTPLPGKTKEYFDTFQEAGIPDKVNKAWLESLGFKSGNDWYIVKILKYIGFIDGSNAPTDLWKQYKDPTKAKVMLAQGIRQGYKELFATYTDAYKKDREALYAFFSSKTGKAKATVDLMVSTFVNLCQLADFEKEAPVPAPTPIPTPTPTVTPAPVVQLPITKEGGINVTVNIRLELPATQDAGVYDKIFESLKKHLLTPKTD